jgi:hypothetical protein
LFESIQNYPRFVFRLSYYREVTHHIQGALSMNAVDQFYGFFARASARPVRDRTEGRLEPLDDLDLAKEVLVAFFSLWGKELDREGQPRLGVQIV